MNKLNNYLPLELKEIEKIINELAVDIQHPLNNQRDPQHHECVTALHELMDRADMLRKSVLFI